MCCQNPAKAKRAGWLLYHPAMSVAGKPLQSASQTALPEGYSITHIHFTSRSALQSACGIGSGSHFTSCSFFSRDGGDLFAFHKSGRTYYVVALSDDGKITWCFDVQNWYTKKGSHGLGSGALAAYEVNALCIAVTRAAQKSYAEAKTAEDNTWHALTPEQIRQIAKKESR